VVGFMLSLLAWLFYFNDGLFAVVYTVRCSPHVMVVHDSPAYRATFGLAAVKRECGVGLVCLTAVGQSGGT
jgi:hypothetical protein